MVGRENHLPGIEPGLGAFILQVDSCYSFDLRTLGGVLK